MITTWLWRLFTEYAPQWSAIMDQSLERVVKLAGKSLDLRCPADGNPTPSIRWLKNGLPCDQVSFWSHDWLTNKTRSSVNYLGHHFQSKPCIGLILGLLFLYYGLIMFCVIILYDEARPLSQSSRLSFHINVHILDLWVDDKHVTYRHKYRI